MRSDSIGMFWEDLPPEPKVKKEKPKRVPPEPVWLEPDYLPYLEEARAFNVELYNDEELITLTEPLVMDCECYKNYFLCAFKGVHSGKVAYFEELDRRLLWLLLNKCIVTFNGRKYDYVVLNLFIAAKALETIHNASNAIIQNNLMPWDILRGYKVKDALEKSNHIDLVEVAPLFNSLKVYAGRLHVKRMQDLPFDPQTELSEEQKLIVRLYCVNDLDNTIELFLGLKDEIQLREAMSRTYQIDLRSRSDAQIAEAVIGKSLKVPKVKQPDIPVGMEYYYQPPDYLSWFQTDIMKQTLHRFCHTAFRVGGSGKTGIPDSLKEHLIVRIGDLDYKMGIGGLHSQEKQTYYESNKDNILIDRDVASYYPRIILNQQLFPERLGKRFLYVYEGIVNQRLEAKASGDKITSDTLKITINGSFGKFGNAFSLMYSPTLVVQVTLTGQLSLLLLIEKMHLAGIPVVSANTDGVVMNCPRHKLDQMNAIVKWWEQVTQFETEETVYDKLYSRDVNNYIAVQPDGKVKTKGTFSDTGLRKNPQNAIINDAVIAYLKQNQPVADYIKACVDVTRFLTVRTAKGGAVQAGEYLGSAIRWYKSTEGSEIIYAKNGNLVAGGENAKACMNLPEQLPTDIDYEWYIEQAEKIVKIIQENVAT